MWMKDVMSNISDQESYSRNDLYRIFCGEKEEMNESTFRWMLYNLQREKLLFRIDYDTYSTSSPKALPVYRPMYSEQCWDLMSKIEKQYPGVEFTVFESVLLNEFLNHQIAQNTIYLQIERDVSSYIFGELRQSHPGEVIYKPGTKEFDLYWQRDCIVILELVSQAPLSLENPHEMTAEKMLVDVIADKSISATFSPSELPFLYENVMGSYHVEKRRLCRYAGRRSKTEEIRKYIGGNI